MRNSFLVICKFIKSCVWAGVGIVLVLNYGVLFYIIISKLFLVICLLSFILFVVKNGSCVILVLLFLK